MTLFKNDGTDANTCEKTDTLSNKSSTDSDNSSSDNSSSCSSESESQNLTEKSFNIVLSAILGQNLVQEITEFSKLLQDSKIIFKTKSSKKFWLQYEEKFPYIGKLFALTSINSSSAFIERFFSICGVITTDRNQNIKHELFEFYAMLQFTYN